MDLYMMNCELLATCSALGFLEGDTYHKEPDCLESVKDLVRYLRHEDETRDIRQQLGAAQILQNDLIPILIQYPQEKQLFDAIIRLMVNLTQPALLCFGKLPQDASFRHHFLQIVSYLQAYKEAFANEKIFAVLSEKLYDLLQLDWEQRQEEDNLLIERILLLVRNVLHVPADPDEEKNIDDDANIHDRVLWAMHISGMDDLLKFLACSQSEQQWSLHVLEVISLMFRDQTPEQLAATGQVRSAKERGTDVMELEALRQRELAEKKNHVLQRSSRHSHFGGCYVIQGLKSIGDRDVVMHKGIHNVKNYSHDLGKEVRRVPKRQQLAQDGKSAPRRSALSVRLFLKEFCIEFLKNCYNRLMYLVKDHLIREKAQQHDETYYLWGMAFFMAFNRACTFQPQLVSETVGTRTFHFIQKNLIRYYEMMIIEKKEATSWCRRMHLALKAYQELLTTMHEMDHSQDETVRNSSHILKNNIFYLMEYRELFLTLFRKFDERKQPMSFLKDLVETIHLFLKMLERFCKGRNNIVVQSKTFKRKKKTQTRPVGSDAQPRAPEELEEMWPRLVEQIRKCTQGSEPLPEDVVPFDVASEVPLEEQRAEAMVRIQDSLLAGQIPEALSLLHSAREVWPEGDIFGSPTLDPDEEIELLRQIFFATLPRQAAPETEELEETAEEEEVAEEELASVRVLEKEFSFLDYVRRFATANVVKAYVLLFKNYQQNSSHTNHCIVKMLHRIACDLKMEPLLFQLSLFCIFNRILGDPAAGAYKELVTFAKYIVGKFFALASTNKKVYMELLFWKSTVVVREITQEYTLEEDEGTDSRKVCKWTSEEEEELQELYYKFKEVEGEDVLNHILAHLSTRNRTRKQVAKQLVRMGLANSVRDFPRERKGARIVLWTQDQELELRRLFEEFQGTDDILGNVMRHITAKRSKARIIEKMLSMGLVSDRKELYKKRKRKSGSLSANKDMLPRDLGMPDLDEVNDYEDEEEEENDLDNEEEEESVWEDGDNDVGNRPLDGWTNKKGATTPDRDAQELVQSLKQEGLSVPLLWLQNCLNRTAADRAEEGCIQPVPLVPLSEENEDAIEHKGFQKLLRKLGLRPPANEQESFWRIPTKLSPEQLRQMASFIAQQEMKGDTKGQAAEEEDLSTEEPRCLMAEKEEPIQHPLGPKRSRSISDNEVENDSQSPKKQYTMYLPLPTVLIFFGLLMHHGLEGHLLSMATPPGNTSETNQSTSDSSHVTLQTLLSSVSSKFVQSQLPQKGISCKDLMPDALENFANVSWLPQIFIQAALALALQGAGCSGHAESLLLRLHKELGETDTNALLLMMARALGTANPRHQSNSRAALEFNLDQLTSAQAQQCKGLTHINGALLHGQVHRVYRGFLAAATACRQLGKTCAGVSANSNSSFQVVERDGSYFLPHHGAHSWLHQCRSLARGRRSTSEDCVREKEQKVHAVVEWIPAVSTLYNFATSIYYATQDCTDLAKERALEGAMDLGYDALTAATGGTGSVIVGMALKPGIKFGVRSLVSYFQQEEEIHLVPTNHSGSVIII